MKAEGYTRSCRFRQCKEKEFQLGDTWHNAPRRSSSGTSTAVTSLEIVELPLQLFDGAVSHLQIFVEAVALRNKLCAVSSVQFITQ